MKKTAAAILATLVTTSAFAAAPQSNFRGDEQRGDRHDNQRYDNNRQSYRDNQRVNVTGRVESFSRERDGYRVRLDRGESYWIPSSRLGGRELRVGIDIGLGGIFRGGSINIDTVSWPGGYDRGYDRAYESGFVRGVVDRIDRRDGTALIRDSASRREITVDLRDAGFARLRRGDYVELSGRWTRGGVFDAYRIDSVR
jgi:hypothetical protein